MTTDESLQAYRITRKVRVGGSMFLALLCFIPGLGLLFYFWPLGLIFIVIAFAVDAKTKSISTCGNCGNEVSAISLLCPTCRANLSAPPVGHQIKNAFRQAAIAFLTVILLIIIVTLVIKNRG